MSQGVFVGVDGCRYGWFSVALDINGSLVQCGVYGTFDQLLTCNAEAELVLVDMPIGLSEDGCRRKCDKESVDKLKPHRHSSVFRTPTRQTVREVMRHPFPKTETDRKRAFAAASKVEREIAQKGLTWQAFFISRKIAQLDYALACRAADARPKVREVHPEVCFWALTSSDESKRYAMLNNKKRSRGREERLGVIGGRLLSAKGMYDDLLRYRESNGLSSKVAKDDILDALAAAVTGWLGKTGRGRLATLPEQPPKDSHGLRMEMVYCEPHSQTVSTAADQ